MSKLKKTLAVVAVATVLSATVWWLIRDEPRQFDPPMVGQAADATTKPDAPAADDKKDPSQRMVNFVALLGAVQGLATAFLTLPVILGITTIVFRKQVGAACDAMVKAVFERGGTLEVAAVKVSLPERPAETVDDLRPVALSSLFDVTDEPARTASADVQSIAPQLTFPLSDRVAKHWESKPGQAAKVAAMREALEELRAECTPQASFAEMRPALMAYARALEACRYREARILATLLDEYAELRHGIERMRPSDLRRDADEFALLHAVGVAYAQDKTRWDVAFPFLDRIAWDETNVLYARAGAHWVAAAYHDVLRKREREIGRAVVSRVVIDEVEDVFNRGRQLLRALETWDGRGAPVPPGYYLREIHKDLGSVSAIFAAHIADIATRQRFLDLALPHYKATVLQLPGKETASSLDHNNFAQFYRELGDAARKAGDIGRARDSYVKAHDQIRQAFDDERPSDPAYHDTLARLLLAEGRILEAHGALAEYTVAHARSRAPEELGDYFEIQILAAKLLLRLHEKQPAVGRAAAVQTLERVLAELGELRSGLTADDAASVEAQIQELVGNLHLDPPAEVSLAVAAFERLLALDSSLETPTKKVRAHTSAALAFALAARMRRLESSPLASEELRKKAAKCVTAALEAFKEPDLLDDQRLAALQSAQLLIEERLAAHEDKDATTLAEAIAPFLSQLRETMDTGDIAPSDSTRLLRRLAARHALVSARLKIRGANGAAGPDEIKAIEDLLVPARGIAQFSAEADLELGVFRLNAARAGGESAMAHWQAAIDAFERASQAAVPAMRAEVFRQVSHAYAIRGAISRKAPKAHTG